MPQASIIVRTFNEEKHIGNLLRAIREQEYRDYEIILVDSGSTDSTLRIAREFCDEIISIESRDFTFGYSINAGCRRARGEYFVIISAHAIPTDPTWLRSLLAPFADESVGMVYGRHIGAQTTKFSERRDFEMHFGLDETRVHPLPYFANNANAAVRASAWKVRPFDEYLTGLEDIAWAREHIGSGGKIQYVPTAAAHHIHEESWQQVYNRYRREAIAARRMGIARPPFATPDLGFFLKSLSGDLVASIRDLSVKRLQEIVQFRYQQWRGTRHGWYRDTSLDLAREHAELYFSGSNRGVVISDKQTAHVRDIPIPEVKPGDVLIQVAYTGICSTDLEVYGGVLGYYKEGRARYPIVPGHEFSGTVARLGANVSTVAVGDQVIGECVLSCRACERCTSGSYAACEKRCEVGVMNYHGAYAHFVVLPAIYVHKIPASVSLSVAALAEPLAVVLRGLRRLGDRLNQRRRVAVIGAGPIGNFTAQVLRVRGHAVTIYNRSGARLTYLKHLVDTRETLDGFENFDVLIEATGNQEALQAVLKGSRTDAAILLLGFPYGAFSYNFEDVVGNEKVIIGSVGGAREDFKEALMLLDTLETGPFLNALVPLDEFMRAWELHRSAQHLKVMLQVHPIHLA